MADPRPWVRGTSGPDTMGADGRYLILSGEDGPDTLYAGPSAHFVFPAGGAAFPDPGLAYGARSDLVMVVGAGGSDTIYGTGGRDFLYGGDGNDLIDGAQGNDHLSGGPGDDVFRFRPLVGEITDTAGDHVSDFRWGTDRIDLSAYQNPDHPGAVWKGTAPLTFSGDQLQVGYTPGVDGGVTVRFHAPYGQGFMSGEFSVWLGRNTPQELTKADFLMDWAGTYSYADEHQAKAARLYDTVFDRVPDKGGLEYWRGVLSQGQSLDAVADGFIQSPEFQAVYAGTDNRGFVGKLYENVLERAGEAEGVSFWTAALNEGRADRSDIVCGFSEAPEHVAMVPAGEWVL